MKQVIPQARRSDLVIQELGEEVLIYDLKSNKALSLNVTSALIWQLSAGEKSVAEIAKEVAGKFNSPANEDLVWLALDQLRKENLLKNGSEIIMSYTGATRREVIRRIGFASLVTLPVISSLIAPTALHAQSGNSCLGTTNLALGCSCSVPESCATLCCGVTSTTSLPRFCVPFQADPIGANCRSGCECVTGLCGFGFVCAADASVANGGRCRTNRECVSGWCGSPGGTCSALTGQPCVTGPDCQSTVCLGNNTCQ